MMMYFSAKDAVATVSSWLYLPWMTEVKSFLP